MSFVPHPQFLGLIAQLPHGFYAVLLSCFLEPHQISQTDAPMLACTMKWQFPILQQLHHMRPRYIEQISSFLRSQLGMHRHDPDCSSVGYFKQYFFHKTQYRGRQLHLVYPVTVTEDLNPPSLAPPRKTGSKYTLPMDGHLNLPYIGPILEELRWNIHSEF